MPVVKTVSNSSYNNRILKVLITLITIALLIIRRAVMPVRKVKGGYQYGTKGKVYKNRKDAVKQGQAIAISQIKRGKKP